MLAAPTMTIWRSYWHRLATLRHGKVPGRMPIRAKIRGILAPLPEREGLGVGIAEGDFWAREQKLASLATHPSIPSLSGRGSGWQPATIQVDGYLSAYGRMPGTSWETKDDGRRANQARLSPHSEPSLAPFRRHKAHSPRSGKESA